MRVLVTGGAGFIGSHLCRLLLEKEYSVSVIDSLTYAGNKDNLAGFESLGTFSFYEGQIQDAPLVSRILGEQKIEAIIDTAAETHNDRSLLSATAFLDTNIQGVYTLLEATKDHDLRRILHVSTDEVYGSIVEGEFTEDSPLEPNTPYSASKAAGDLLCRAHYVSYKTPVVITRGGNTYGPNQYPEKLVSLSLVRLLRGKRIPVYGEGAQRREWIHVRDHAAGILTAFEKGSDGEVYNISDTNERENRWIVTRLLERLNLSEELVKRIPDPREGAHDFRYSMSSGKLRQLGWRPEVSFEAGLNDTIDWYRDNPSWWESTIADANYQEFMRRFYGKALGDDL
ncbi:MAG: dTDP-glucose 4,6-dehydratase [Armatimonadota bacterium]|nr:dTDP-glucose 4,6-dehydratase [Armatimonadota bacterium]